MGAQGWGGAGEAGQLPGLRASEEQGLPQPLSAGSPGLHYLSREQRGWRGESHCWPSYGNLINLFTAAPTGPLSPAFCPVLTTAPPPVGPALPEGARGDKRTPLDQSPATALAPTTGEALPPAQAGAQPPAQLGLHSPAWGTVWARYWPSRTFRGLAKAAREAAANSLQGLQPVSAAPPVPVPPPPPCPVLAHS